MQGTLTQLLMQFEFVLAFLIPMKRQKNWILLFFAGFLCGAVASIPLWRLRGATMLYRIGLAVIDFSSVILTIYLCTRQKPAACFYVASWCVMTYSVMLYLWHPLYNWMQARVAFSISYFWAAAFLLLGAALLGLTFGRILPVDGQYDVGPRKFILCVVTLLVFECIHYNGVIYISTATYYVCFIISMVLCVTLLYLQYTLFQKSAYSQEVEILRLLGQQQKQQYALAQENIAIINEKCHDLRRQVAALKLIGDSGERERYINELRSSLNIYDSAVRTGNDALDTLLTEKSLYCVAHGITINCVADGSQLDFIDTVDLYTLMSNAIDNAIESVEKIPDVELHSIDVQLYRKQNWLVLRILNPVQGTIQFADGLPVTTKADKNNHGFGMKSIRHTTEKYMGHLSCRQEDDNFILQAVFPIPTHD